MADFTAFLTAPREDRRGAFLATAARLDTSEVNVEKDFWVCWTLDALFNRLTGERPRLLLPNLAIIFARAFSQSFG